MNVLRLADPAGVVERTPKFKNKRPKKVFFSKGPNYLWSLDGHNKLSGAANCQFDLKIYGYVTCSDLKEIDDHTLLAWVQDVVDESSGQLGYRNVTEKLRCIDWSQERKKNV